MAASTIGTNVRGWREVSSAAHWTARVLWDTGTALYAVVQDTGATPKVRVMKADSRTAPTTWTEQDSADNKAITNVDYPFSSWLHTNGDLHIVAFSATNTLTHYVFDTDTDQWATGNGNISTAVENEHTVRCCVRSDGDILAFFTSNADDADLGWFVWQGANWATGGVTGILSANSTGASNVLDAGIDSTDRAWVVFYDPSAGDVSYVTVDSANTVAAVTDIDATGPANLNQNTGARYALYDDAGTDTIVAAYRPQASAIEERAVTLESDANTANLSAEVSVEATTTDVGDRTPVSTAVVGGVPYCAWWDDASSGTIKVSTKSGGAWATETNVATGITKLIEIVPVGIGLVVVYQSSNDVLTDWIVDPFLAASLTVTPADATAAGGSVTLTGIIPARVLVSWAEVEIPAAEGVSGSLTVTAAMADAAGGTVNLAAASLFTVAAASASAAADGALNVPNALTVTEAAASAAGGAVNFAAASNLTVTASGASAAADATLDAASLLTVTPATATAAGGDVDLSGAGGASLIVSPAPGWAGSGELVTDESGNPVLDGGGLPVFAGPGVNLMAASLFAVTASTATADGGAVNLAASVPGSLTVVAATATASADGSLIGQAILTVTPATAPAAADGALSGQGVLTVTPATASASADATLDAAALFAVDTATASADAFGTMTGESDIPGVMGVNAATADAAGGDILFTAPATIGVVAASASALADGALTVPNALTVTASEASADGGTIALAGQGTLAVSPASATAQSDGVSFVAAALMTLTPTTATAESTSVLAGQGALAVDPAPATAAADGTFDAAATMVLVAAEAGAAADADLIAATPATLTVSPASASADAFASLLGNVALVITPAESTAASDASFSASSVFAIDVATATGDASSVTLRAPQWFVLYARVMIDPAVSFSTRLAPAAAGGDLRPGPAALATVVVEAG